MADVSKITDAILQGNKRTIAKAITHIENVTPIAEKIVSSLYSHTGRAQIIGITGPGGVGKSTLIEKLVKEFRNQNQTVAVIAVDPTSPFSGGAFLGDRIRMQNLSMDEGVFIRSMATRSNPGGLSRATRDTVRVLDASGRDVIIVETVGAGQSEIDIIKIAPTVIVVLAPGFGDEIQAIKAGIMEIGDIFVINKSDRENANKAVIDIKAMLQLGNKKEGWIPPVLKTNALTGGGINELMDKIRGYKEFLNEGDASSKLRRIVREEFEEALRHKATEYVLAILRKEGELDRLISRLTSKEIDPFSAAEEALNKFLLKPKEK